MTAMITTKVKRLPAMIPPMDDVIPLSPLLVFPLLHGGLGQSKGWTVNSLSQMVYLCLALLSVSSYHDPFLTIYATGPCRFSEGFPHFLKLYFEPSDHSHSLALVLYRRPSHAPLFSPTLSLCLSR